jgi:hypothetical protein
MSLLERVMYVEVLMKEAHISASSVLGIQQNAHAQQIIFFGRLPASCRLNNLRPASSRQCASGGSGVVYSKG